MARRDGTGPFGEGPNTGRGLGDCTTRRTGFRNFSGRFCRFFTDEKDEVKNEEKFLKNKKEALMDEIEEIEKELKDLKK